MCLYRLGWKNYFVWFSFDYGRTMSSHTYFDLFKTPFNAAEAAWRELRHSIPATGTMLIYHYPVVQRWPDEAPNKLELVIDYNRNELFFISWAMHEKRIAPNWQQLALLSL